MNTEYAKVVVEDAGATYLSTYMEGIIYQLKKEQKFSGARMYRYVLHSFQNFADGSNVP